MNKCGNNLIINIEIIYVLYVGKGYYERSRKRYEESGEGTQYVWFEMNHNDELWGIASSSGASDFN